MSAAAAAPRAAHAPCPARRRPRALRPGARGSGPCPTAAPNGGRAPQPRRSRGCGACARTWSRGCPARRSASRPRRRRRGVAVPLLLLGGGLGGSLALGGGLTLLRLLALLADELGLGLDFFLGFGLQARRRQRRDDR